MVGMTGFWRECARTPIAGNATLGPPCGFPFGNGLWITNSRAKHHSPAKLSFLAHFQRILLGVFCPISAHLLWVKRAPFCMRVLSGFWIYSVALCSLLFPPFLICQIVFMRHPLVPLWISRPSRRHFQSKFLAISSLIAFQIHPLALLGLFWCECFWSCHIKGARIASFPAGISAARCGHLKVVLPERIGNPRCGHGYIRTIQRCGKFSVDFFHTKRKKPFEHSAP